MDKEALKQELLLFISENRGKIIGGIIGFIFGVFFLVFGFLRTLVLLICTVVGLYLGARWDIDGSLQKLIDKILPPQLR